MHPGEWPGDTRRRESTRKLRALALAPVPETERRGRLPALPRRGHGAGERRRRLDSQRGQGLVSPARVRGLPPFRGLRQGTGRPELHGTADQTNGGGEEGELEAGRVPDEAGG